MVVKLIIDKAKELADGKYTIRIYIYDPVRKQKRYLSPKEIFRVEEKFWDGHLVHKSHPNHAYINSMLKKQCMELEANFLKNPEGSIDEVLYRPKKTTFKQFLGDYRVFLDAGKAIGKKGQPLSPSYIKSVKNSIHVIERFFEADRERDFPEITEDFYAAFVTWLRFEINYNENTVGRVIKDLKKMLKVARKKKLHDTTDYEDFVVTRFESYSIALDESEIDAMMALKLPEHLWVEADRFYVAYNFLLRFTDSIVIDKRDIITRGKKKYLKTMTSKTRGNVEIPLLPRTYGILKKYDFKLPKTTNQESNWKIKEIGRLAKIKEPTTIIEIRKGNISKRVEPKYKLITTHTARRSMATNLWRNGFSLPEIQLLGGWTGLTSLQKYLKVDKSDIAKKAGETKFFNRG